LRDAAGVKNIVCATQRGRPCLSRIAAMREWRANRSIPMNELHDRVKQIMAVVFNLPAGDLGDDPALMATPGWDSLGHAQLMLALEEEFSIRIPTDAVIELQSLAEIVEYLGQHSGSGQR
jgi:acyl carrier protein